MNPATGPVGGGTVVAVTGGGLTGVTAVQIGAANAAFRVVSDAQLSITSPAAGAAGAVDVVAADQKWPGDGRTVHVLAVKR